MLKKPLFRRLAFLALALSLATAFNVQGDSFPGAAACGLPQTRLSLVDKIPNFHVVAPGIVRSAKPDRAGLELLRREYGLKTVIDLRAAAEAADEKKISEELGLRFVNVPMDSSRPPARAEIERVLKILGAAENQPVLVHCAAGKDRAGLVVAAYRILRQQWTLAAAEAEMLSYGYDVDAYPKIRERVRELANRKE